MKSAKYRRRHYRDWVYSRDLYRQRVVDKQTDLEIFTDRPVSKCFARERAGFYRGQVEDYINYIDRRFLVSLKPIEVSRGAPKIVSQMAQAGRQAGVGPMAAVAGAVAQFLGGDLLAQGYKEIIIENGGDIFISGQEPRLVAVYSGRGKWAKLRLKLNPRGASLGVCASSATIGHSLSFGGADSAVVIAKNAPLADAVATALCNRAQDKAELKSAVQFAGSIESVLGALIVFGDTIAAWGDVELAGV